MYPKLKAEMERINIKARDIASLLNLHENTVYGKISGKYKFSLNEANKIKEKFFPSIYLEELFQQRKNDDE